MVLSESGFKVLHLTTHLNPGGITTYLSLAGPSLAGRGHQVAVLSSGGENEPLFAPKGVPSHRFPIKAKSILHPKIWGAFPGVLGLVKREKFDVLHAHTRVTQALAAAVSRATGVPVVTTAHGFFKRNLGRKLFPCWGDRVIAVSPLVAEALEKTHRVPKDRIRVIFNAIDTAGFKKRLLEKNPPEIRRRLGIPADAVVIGSVSRLVRDKGHEFLLEAAALLRKNKRNVFVLIVGDGRERKRLQSLAKKKKIPALFVPQQSDITESYAVMDVFSQPATYREGFGLTLLEAMAAKIPIVASDIFAINSIVRNRVNGFLVAPKSAKDIAGAVEFILDHPDVAGSIAQNAYEAAQREYSLDRMAGEMEAVYAEVVAVKGRKK